MRDLSQYKTKRLLRRRLSRGIIVLGLLVGSAGAFYAVRALSDTTPLTIDTMTLSSQSVNLDNGPADVTVSGTVSDNLSGFGWVKMYYRSPSGHQVVEVQTVSHTPTSFEATVTFPLHGEAGQWVPTATFSDASGNTQDYTSQQLADLGLPVAVSATSSNPDTVAPVVSGFQQIYSSLDVTQTTQDITGNVIVDDDNSGVGSVVIKMISPSGLRFVTLYGEQVSSIKNSYSFANPFPMFSEAGRWVAQVTVTDLAGNTRVYDPADLAGMGFDTSVTITDNIVDTEPAIVESIGFSPLSNPDYVTDTLPGGAVITAKGMLLDSLSGIRDPMLIYNSQTSQQSTPYNTFVVGTQNPDAEYDFLIATPPYPAQGDWLPELTIIDQIGNTKTYTYLDLLKMGVDMKIHVGDTTVSTAPAGGTVTTDTSNSGTSESAPVQIAVTTPVAGNITMNSVQTAASATDFSGYDIVGNQYTISAPAATAQNPLVLTFTIDASEVNGVNPNDIAIFRDGSPVGKCLGSAVAVPDPCETAVSTDANGNVTVTVNSSHASRWVLGAKSPMFTFKGFKKPTFGGTTLNTEKAGSTVPVKFSLGGDYGLDVLANSSPSSQEVDCTTLAPKGDLIPAVSANKKDLKYNANDLYRYDWKTLKSWDNTCRQFKLTFTDGETATTYFKFK